MVGGTIIISSFFFKLGAQTPLYSFYPPKVKHLYMSVEATIMLHNCIN